jgi:MYXO-CTERM domain-containing protein
MWLFPAPAAAAPPALHAVAASDGAAPGVPGALFTEVSDVHHTTDGALIWKGTVMAGTEERLGFWRVDDAGVSVLLEGAPAPDGGVFDSFSGVALTSGGHAGMFLASAGGPSAVWAHDASGVRRVVGEGDPVTGGAALGPFALIAVNADDDVLVRETVDAYHIALVAVLGGVATRFVTFDEGVDGLPGWFGNRLNQAGYLADDGRLTFSVADAGGVIGVAHGQPGALRVVEPDGWLPDDDDGVDDATCCSLLTVGRDAAAVFLGRELSPDGDTTHVWWGDVAAPDEVLVIPPGGVPVADVVLTSMDVLPPLLAPGAGFAFTGQGTMEGVGFRGVFAWTVAGGLAFVAGPGTEVAGRPLAAPVPLAFGGGHLLLSDTTAEGVRLVDWDAATGTLSAWFSPGDPAEHPIDGEQPLLAALYTGASQDLDAGNVVVELRTDGPLSTSPWVLVSTTVAGAPDPTTPTTDGADGGRTEEGCGCATGRHPAWLGLLVGLAALRARRRRP